jgi:hypothetical protein
MCITIFELGYLILFLSADIKLMNTDEIKGNFF